MSEKDLKFIVAMNFSDQPVIAKMQTMYHGECYHEAFQRKGYELSGEYPIIPGPWKYIIPYRISSKIMR